MNTIRTVPTKPWPATSAAAPATGRSSKPPNRPAVPQPDQFDAREAETIAQLKAIAPREMAELSDGERCRR